MDLKKYIGTVHDFPTKGIIFRDINKLISNPDAFKYTIDELTKKAIQYDVDVIAVADARGFIFGSTIAYLLKKKLVLIRKPGKLPGDVYKADYESEYSKTSFEFKKGIIKKGEKVLLIDDVLATGGTISAMSELVRQSGGIVVAALFVLNINIPDLDNINYDFEIYSLVNY